MDWNARLKQCRAAVRQKQLVVVSGTASEAAQTPPPCAEAADLADSWPETVAAVSKALHDWCRSSSSHAPSGSTTRATTTTTIATSRLRLVLRVALVISSGLPPPPSPLPNDSGTRRDYDDTVVQWQTRVFYEWHDALIQIIATVDDKHRPVITVANGKQPSPSIPCLAARVLCNTITHCPETARYLLQTTLSLVPKDKVTTILSCKTDTHRFFNWVDLLLVTAKCQDRLALAAIVACLHNALVALTDKTNDKSHPNNCSARNVASCGLLVATLLRHLVTASAILQSVATAAACMRDDGQPPSVSQRESTDEATEWILLLLAKLCRLGYLPVMYDALHPNVPMDNTDARKTVLVPEQIVLLHCVRTAVESVCTTATASGSISSPDQALSRCRELGGEADSVGCQTGIEKTHHFLATLYVSLQTQRKSNETEEMDDGLRTSAQQLFLDILAETLAEDSIVAAKVRRRLGTATGLLHALLVDLAVVLDAWHEQNNQTAATVRQQTKLSAAEQCRLTAMVRVLGNLCFECRENQDQLRSIVVPPTSPSFYSLPAGRDSIDQVLSAPLAERPRARNGLHVLLSTTSLSYVCFTLREWVVVAIRSALTDNLENQAVVAELHASQAIQSTELLDMGLRVQVDGTTGSVSIAPLTPPTPRP
jgi:Spinocerebellar ataxia type 10 protein domain